MKVCTAIITAILITGLSYNASACGDSLYRVGKGMSYRTYSAPLPGNLLVYGDTEGARSLADELEKSGHGVRLVASPDDLAAELGKGGYDVIIAPYSEHSIVEANGNVTFLPIVSSDVELQQASQTYKRVMIPEKHEIKHYLKAIHLSLKSAA